MTPQLVIGTVHPDLIDAQFTACLVQTLTEDYQGYLPIRARVLMSRAPAGMIHIARNAIVQGFLEHPLKPPYLLFIDTDITWTPEQVWALIDTARERELLAVGGLVSFNLPGEDGPGESVPMLYDEDFRVLEPTEDVQRVFCGGMGFMALHRDALIGMGRHYGWPTPWFDYGARNGKAVSEDVMFCQRCLDLDIPVHVDTRIRVGHRKTHAFKQPALSCVAV